MLHVVIYGSIAQLWRPDCDNVTLTAITALQPQLSALCQHGAATKRMGHSPAAAAVIVITD